MTGMSAFSAKATSSSVASPQTTPCPAMTMGRSAALMASAARRIMPAWPLVVGR